MFLASSAYSKPSVSGASASGDDVNCAQGSLAEA